MRLLPTLALLILPGLASALPAEPTKPMPRITRGFMENKGQVVDQEHRPNAAVRYLWEGSGYNVQLRHTGFSYDHYQVEGKPQEQGTDAPRMHPDTAAPEPVVMHLHRVDVELLGMNVGYGVETLDQLPGHFNFYTAGTPYGGATHVQHYGRVRYTEVYPGIDIEFVLDREIGFKYNVIARPGADLSAVRMRITGPTEQHVEHGEVVMQTRFGEVREAVPHSYWRTPAGEVPVEVGFVDLGDDAYGLKAASPTPGSATLVVDPQPEVLYATFFGGAYVDGQNGLVLMPNGHVILYGYSRSSGLGTSGTAQEDLASVPDGLVACFNAAGGFEWATYAGGTALEQLVDGAATTSGTFAAVGNSNSPNIFSIDSSMVNPYPGYQALILRLDIYNGTTVFGCSLMGGPGSDAYQAIAADTNGYSVTGQTTLTNLGTPGAFNTVGPGPFVRHYSPLGILEWTTYGFCGDHMDMAPTGEIWIAAESSYARVSADGSSLQSWQLPPFTDQPAVVGMAVLETGDILLLGNTTADSMATTPNALFGTPTGNPAGIGFILEVDTLGNIEYATEWCGVNQIVKGVGREYYTISLAFQWLPLDVTTPLCNDVGTRILTKFNGEHLREWSAAIGIGSTLGMARDPLSGMIVGGFAHTFTTPDSYQQAPDSVYTTDFCYATMQPCTSAPLPALGPVTGATGSCSNTPVTYSVAAVTGVNYYFWQPPPAGSVVSGQGTPTAQIALGPIAGFVRVMAMDSCVIGPASALPVALAVPAQVSVAPSGLIQVCPGDSVQLVATANGTVQWSNGVSSNSIWVPAATASYTATVTTVDGCTSTSNATSTTTAQLLPINITGPVQADDDDTLSYTVNANTGDISSLWSLDGGTFIGPFNTNTVAVHWTDVGPGYVAVHRTQIHNCDVYDTLFVQVNSTIGIPEQALVPLQVYPNPASTQVTVVPGGQWRPGMRYAVLNALGQEVLFGALPASGVQPVDLSTRSLSAGVYTLQTTLDGKTDAVVRLVVER